MRKEPKVIIKAVLMFIIAVLLVPILFIAFTKNVIPVFESYLQWLIKTM